MEEPHGNDLGGVGPHGIRMNEDQELTFILIGEIGDIILTNTDENAAKIIDILGDDIWKTK